MWIWLTGRVRIGTVNSLGIDFQIFSSFLYYMAKMSYLHMMETHWKNKYAKWINYIFSCRDPKMSLSFIASLPEDHFQCSICMNVFNDPVTTPCGHSFCKTCLTQHWGDGELCHCPACNKRFHAMPEFSTNALIAEISDQIKRRRVEAVESTDAPGLVKCDVCAEVKFRASKSCLVCLTSYCEAHLEPHHRVPSLMRHKLIEPVEDLEDRICEKHQRILEFFCRDEQVCVCLLCTETDHRDHETVPVEEEAAQQKVRISIVQFSLVLLSWNNKPIHVYYIKMLYFRKLLSLNKQRLDWWSKKEWQR